MVWEHTNECGKIRPECGRTSTCTCRLQSHLMGMNAVQRDPYFYPHVQIDFIDAHINHLEASKPSELAIMRRGAYGSGTYIRKLGHTFQTLFFLRPTRSRVAPRPFWSCSHASFFWCFCLWPLALSCFGCFAAPLLRPHAQSAGRTPNAWPIRLIERLETGAVWSAPHAPRFRRGRAGARAARTVES